MKKILFIIIILAVIYSQISDVQKKQALDFWNNFKAKTLNTYVPCREPIAYNIGSFDEDFGISREYFLSALADAEKIWEGPSGRDLFVYDLEKGTLPINLIYDYRQETTTKLGEINKDVKSTQNEYDTLRAKYLNLKSIYEKENADFAVLVVDFNKRQRDYNREVQSWNEKGGAPEAEYVKLQATKFSLSKDEAILKSREKVLHSKAVEVNTLVVELNDIAKSLNINVDKYNEVGDTLGESFEEGLYTDDGINQKIDIFEFSTREKLVRILAHELGHALGIEHVADKEAIMYELNSGNKLIATESDLSALNAICK